MTILVQQLRAEIEQLKAENAEMRRILQLAVTLEGPLHAHTRHQIWDGSEKRCAWCAVHDEAQQFFSTQRQAMTKEQP